jgi:hypothetical protein
MLGSRHMAEVEGKRSKANMEAELQDSYGIEHICSIWIYMIICLLKVSVQHVTFRVLDLTA